MKSKLLIIIALVCLLPFACLASHFRFASTYWKRISNNQDGSVTVQFTAIQYCRESLECLRAHLRKSPSPGVVFISNQVLHMNVLVSYGFYY